MIFGIPPFYHTNHNKMFEMINDAEVTFSVQVSCCKEAKDFILKVKIHIENFLSFFKCLLKDPKQRIGSVADVEEIKSHPWFDDLDWDALIHKKV